MANHMDALDNVDVKQLHKFIKRGRSDLARDYFRRVLEFGDDTSVTSCLEALRRSRDRVLTLEFIAKARARGVAVALDWWTGLDWIQNDVNNTGSSIKDESDVTRMLGDLDTEHHNLDWWKSSTSDDYSRIEMLGICLYSSNSSSSSSLVHDDDFVKLISPRLDELDPSCGDDEEESCDMKSFDDDMESFDDDDCKDKHRKKLKTHLNIGRTQALEGFIRVGRKDIALKLYVVFERLSLSVDFHRPLTHDAHELACPQLLLLAHGISLENQCSNAIFSLEQAHLASRQAIDIVTQGFRHRPTRCSNTHSHTKNLTRASHSNTGTVNIIMKVMSIR